MMASCPGCNTSYSIDERKLPAQGARLTCPECGKRWKVSQAQQIEISEAAAKGGRPGAAAATRPSPARADSRAAGASPAGVPAPAAERSPGPAPAPAAASTTSFAESSGTLQKPVNCPKCGHYFVPYQSRMPIASSPVDAAQAKPRRRVLLVEDQVYFTELTREALGESIETVVAGTLSEARERVESGEFDLVILDLSLEEGQDGSQVLQATRRKTIPVLIFTARDETELYGSAWDQLRAAGATDILFKGMNVADELRQKVHSLLSAVPR